MTRSFSTLLHAMLTANGKTQADLWAAMRDAGDAVSRSAVSQWCSDGGPLPQASRMPVVLDVACATTDQRDTLLSAFIREAGLDAVIGLVTASDTDAKPAA